MSTPFFIPGPQRVRLCYHRTFRFVFFSLAKNHGEEKWASRHNMFIDIHISSHYFSFPWSCQTRASSNLAALTKSNPADSTYRYLDEVTITTSTFVKSSFCLTAQSGLTHWVGEMTGLQASFLLIHLGIHPFYFLCTGYQSLLHVSSFADRRRLRCRAGHSHSSSP